MIKYYASGFILVLSLVASLNYYIDIENNFWRYKQYPVVAIPTDKVLVVPANRKERDDRLKYIKSMPLEKCIVIGSSRSLQWGNIETSIQVAISNLSVSTASIEEMAALYEAALETGHVPSHLILSLDPWMINEHVRGDDYEWLERTGYFDRFQARVMRQVSDKKFFNKINKKFINSYKYSIKSIVSRERLLASIKSIKTDSWRGKKYYFLQNPEALDEHDYAIRSDGVLLYPKQSLSMTQEKIDKEAKETPNPLSDYLFTNFTPSQKKWAILESLIQDAKEKGIQVMVISSPFHPDTYQRLQSLPMYQDAMENWTLGLKELSSKTLVWDVTNPESTTCLNTDFIDGIHMNVVCIKKVFQKCKFDTIERIIHYSAPPV